MKSEIERQDPVGHGEDFEFNRNQLVLHLGTGGGVTWSDLYCLRFPGGCTDNWLWGKHYFLKIF